MTSTGTCLYPRARGADDTGLWELFAAVPLPPRTRGRLPASLSDEDNPASTPAHAGPTRNLFVRAQRFPLYPRARGADLTVYCITANI